MKASEEKRQHEAQERRLEAKLGKKPASGALRKRAPWKRGDGDGKAWRPGEAR